MATKVHMKRAVRRDDRSQTDWQESLVDYRRKAALTFEVHRPDGTTCGACGQRWPCSRVVAAENMLEL